jgi:hypothetical protein
LEFFMDGSGSNLTIDFSDASFDNSDENVQPIPGADNIDVVFPLDDNGETTIGSGEYEKTGYEFSDNRTSTSTPAQAIALMPNDSIASAMDEFMFEFDNDEDGDDATTTDQGLKITTKGEGPNASMQELNLQGPFANLHDGGTLDIHIETTNDNGEKVYEMVTAGLAESDDPTSGTVVGGDTNGANMLDGDDSAVINVDATTTIQGMYKGGSGFDTLQLVEGVREDNGAIVDFFAGVGGASSAQVKPASDLATEVAFQIDEWESIQLTDNADSIYISAGVGNGLTTSYDTSYWNPGSGNSMIKLQTGFTDGGTPDYVSINADSNVYLSFEFANDSDVGIKADFTSDDVNIIGIGGSANSSTIDVDVEKAGGSGMTIDYFEATSNSDVITNMSNIGVMVDLGGSSGTADRFEGSSSSVNDVLDARAVQDLDFSSQNPLGDPAYIDVKSVDSDGNADNLVNATLSNVDYIMVTDQGSDVDFYQDMSDLNGSQIIDGLGTGAVDSFGAGYDVITSAQVDKFGTSSNKRVYYEGDHDDFTDIDDDMTYTDGQFMMSSGDSSRGSNWESDIESQYSPGQQPGFYIEIGGTKLAVTMDQEKNAWKVDTTAIKVAEGASSNIDLSGINQAQFAADVMQRYNLEPAAPPADGGSVTPPADGGGSVTPPPADGGGSVTPPPADGSGSVTPPPADGSGSVTPPPADGVVTPPVDGGSETPPVYGETITPPVGGPLPPLAMNDGTSPVAAGDNQTMNVNHSFSGEIYLNATEEAIQQLINHGSVSNSAFNFSFYTKMDLETADGDVTVNIKLQNDGGNQFSVDANDIDVAVESFYNVADDKDAAVTSGGAAGEFVKIDNSSDIVLGNGGDDTYVVGDDGSDIYGGIALEYGDLDSHGGLKKTTDAVNFNSVDSVDDLTFRRGKERNEEDGNTLYIGQSDENGDTVGNETIIFDNYNEYLDFRRVEFLTVEDGANNDEIYEIVTNSEDNITDWDNEIYVANGGSMDVQLGGIDYVFGSVDKDGNAINADTFNVSLSDIMSAGSGTVNLSNVTSDDTINVTDADTYMTADEQVALEQVLAQGVAAGGGEVQFSLSGSDLSIQVANLQIDDTYNLSVNTFQPD